MIVDIKYGKYLPLDNTITITNDKKQSWELKRYGISEEEVKQLVKSLGNTNAIKKLLEDKKLLPVYGGNLNL